MLITAAAFNKLDENLQQGIEILKKAAFKEKVYAVNLNAETQSQKSKLTATQITTWPPVLPY